MVVMKHRGGTYTEHNFYCLNCGKKGIPLMRKRGYEREKMHRKKLYCPTCRFEVNHIECRTFAEVEEFRENFANGVYKEEAASSISYINANK